MDRQNNIISKEKPYLRTIEGQKMMFIIENNEYKEREIELVKMMILFTNKIYQHLGIKLKYVLRKIVMINDNQNQNQNQALY